MSTFLTLLGFGIVSAAILAVGTAGLSLQFGVTNYINFAYGEFMTFGAMIGWTLSAGPLHLPLWVGVLGGMVATALLAAAVQRWVFAPFIRRRPQLLFALIVTFAVSVIILYVNSIIWGTSDYELPTLLPFGSSFRAGPISIDANNALYVLLALAAFGTLQLLLSRTYVGKVMRAMSDSPGLAATCGLNVARVTDVTWLITGALAGLTGILLAIETHTFTVLVGDTYLFLLFTAVIVGGIGSQLGALVGAAIVGIASQVTTQFLPTALALVGVFAVLVVVILIRPIGIFGDTIEVAQDR